MMRRLLFLMLTTHIGCAPLLGKVTNRTRLSSRKKLINFNFDNEDLVNIINYVAAEQNVNVILPLPPNTITAKVRLNNQEKMPVDAAFTKLNTLLDVAGYSM